MGSNESIIWWGESVVSRVCETMSEVNDRLNGNLRLIEIPTGAAPLSNVGIDALRVGGQDPAVHTGT